MASKYGTAHAKKYIMQTDKLVRRANYYFSILSKSEFYFPFVDTEKKEIFFLSSFKGLSEEVKKVLEDWCVEGRFSQTLVLCDRSGVGKTSLASALAKKLNYIPYILSRAEDLLGVDYALTLTLFREEICQRKN